jgi:hypothetical protein
MSLVKLLAMLAILLAYSSSVALMILLSCVCCSVDSDLGLSCLNGAELNLVVSIGVEISSGLVDLWAYWNK